MNQIMKFGRNGLYLKKKDKRNKTKLTGVIFFLLVSTMFIPAIVYGAQNNLSPDNLLPGDIILCRGTNDDSDVIPGMFAHVVLYGGIAGDHEIWDYHKLEYIPEGTPWVIHSHKNQYVCIDKEDRENISKEMIEWYKKNGRYYDGVRTDRFSYFVNERYPEVLVLRVSGSVGSTFRHLTAGERHSVIKFAMSKLGQPYPDDNINYADFTSKGIHEKYYYCSEIIWAAYKGTIGIDLDAEVYDGLFGTDFLGGGVAPEDLYWSYWTHVIASDMDSSLFPSTNKKYNVSSDIYTISVKSDQALDDDDWFVGDMGFPTYSGPYGGPYMLSHDASIRVMRACVWDDWRRIGLYFDWTAGPAEWHSYIDKGWIDITTNTLFDTTVSEYRFQLKIEAPPHISIENRIPGRGQTGVGTSPTLSVDVSDLDSNFMDVIFYGKEQGTDDFTLLRIVSDVPRGGTASITWWNLEYETTYRWYVKVDDGRKSIFSYVWSFTTVVDNKPTASDPSPADGATDVRHSPTLGVYVSDPDGDRLGVKFWGRVQGSDDEFEDIGGTGGIGSGYRAEVPWYCLLSDTTYEWYAVVDDGNKTTTSDTWSFTTESDNTTRSEISHPSPPNCSTGISTNITLSVDVSDPDHGGGLKTIRFYGKKQGTDDFSLLMTKSDIPYEATVSITWSNLDYSTEYKWYVTVTDYYSRIISDTWTFTTAQNHAPDIYELSPAISVDTINPTLRANVYDLDGDTMTVRFYGGESDTDSFTLLGIQSSVPSGGTASIVLSGLDYNMSYEWYVVASDGDKNTRSLTARFSTPITSNHPPQIGGMWPAYKGDTGISPTLTVDVSDPDGDAMKVIFYGGLQDPCGIDVLGSVDDVPSGGTASITWSGLSYGQTYEWYVVAYDGKEITTSSTVPFATGQAPNHAPDEPSNPQPSPGATGVDTNPTLSVTVSDPDGDPMEVTFYTMMDEIIKIIPNVPSGSTVSAKWSGLYCNGSYAWYVKVDDGDKSWSNPRSPWPFRTRDNLGPKVGSMWPSYKSGIGDLSTSSGFYVTLEVDVSDPDDDTMTVSFYDGSGSLIGKDYNVGSGDTAKKRWTRLSSSTKYEWYVVADDGNKSTKSSIAPFVTRHNNAPQVGSMSPASTRNTGTSPTLKIRVSDPDGDRMKVSFYDGSGKLIGRDYNVSSGGTASIPWKGLSYSTTYQWYAVVTDGDKKKRSSTVSFATGLAPC